jgi:hypothetical protein
MILNFKKGLATTPKGVAAKPFFCRSGKKNVAKVGEVMGGFDL